MYRVSPFPFTSTVPSFPTFLVETTTDALLAVVCAACAAAVPTATKAATTIATSGRE
jgi:hypothetical protein